jgi:hypothetical protein
MGSDKVDMGKLKARPGRMAAGLHWPEVSSPPMLTTVFFGAAYTLFYPDPALTLMPLAARTSSHPVSSLYTAERHAPDR